MLRFPQHDKRLKGRYPATAIEGCFGRDLGPTQRPQACGERSSTAKPHPYHTALTRWVSGRRLATICIFY